MRVPLSSMLLMIVATTLCMSLGCQKATLPATPLSSTHQYPIRGTVVSTDSANGEVLLKHDEIAGLMPAMAMSYHLEDVSALSELHPGDLVSATLLADIDAAGPKNLRLKDIDILSQASPDYKPKVQFYLPVTGDVVPNFTLLNQSDRKINLNQFHGKVIVMTFIYTRCPLSDYCPRMSRNFAIIDKALQADPELYSKTHLISVSFDPSFDTPKVLRSYGSAYTGKYVNETFRHWEFAVPSVEDLPKLEKYFDVGVTPGEDGALQHSLSTVVIGKSGKVVAFYPTNDWTPAQVLAQIHSASL